MSFWAVLSFFFGLSFDAKAGRSARWERYSKLRETLKRSLKLFDFENFPSISPPLPVVHPPSKTLKLTFPFLPLLPPLSYLTEVDPTGFLFFTNYSSRKSLELAANPNASLAFYWRETSRQVRVVGRAEKLTRAESDAYFQSRPRGSRLGAWASEQSKVIGEHTLEERVKEIEAKFGTDPEGKVDCPENWGGWRVVPE